MGQYYHAVILKENKVTVKRFLESWDYSNGAKLMEHSYIGNNFVEAFESQLLSTPQRVVWAGDYADECKNRKSNIWDRCKPNLKGNVLGQVNHDNYKYIVNHSKKQYVNKALVPMIEGWEDGFIHPLPLLTCEGNNRGGGDYRPRAIIEYQIIDNKVADVVPDDFDDDDNPISYGPIIMDGKVITDVEFIDEYNTEVEYSNSLVGSWARDLISIENELPKDFELVKFELKE